MKHIQWIFLVSFISATMTVAGVTYGQEISQGGVAPPGENYPEHSVTTDKAEPLLVSSQDSAYELLAATLVLEAGLRDAKIAALAEIADHLKTVESFRTALVKDIETAGEGGFSLVRSHTLEQIGRFGIEKMPELVEHLKATGKLKKSFAVPDLAWAGDLVDAIHEDIQATGESPWVLVKSHTLEEIGKIGLKGVPVAVEWLQEKNRLSKSFKVPELDWTAGFFKAVGQDIEESGAGGFVLWRSHTLEQSARILLDKMPAMVVTLRQAGKLPAGYSLPFLSGAPDIATASGKYLGAGHADLETTTLFWDGVNKTMWAVAGSLWGGEKGAEVSQAFGDAAAKLGRELTQPIFNKAVLLGSGQAQQLFTDWQTLQRKRVQLGLPVQSMKEVYGEELLRKNGFAEHAIKAMETPFAGSVAPAGQERRADVQLYWTDTGITLFGRPNATLVHMGSEFIPLFDVEKEGRIVVRMPVMKDGKGKERYLTDSEWQGFETSLASDLRGRLRQLTQEKGIQDIEIRTVQDINIFGYNDQRRQEEVRRFTRAFLHALDTVKNEMAKTESVACYAATGSNAANAAARIIPQLQQAGKNPIERVMIIDGRAVQRDMELLIEAMDRKVFIVNTAGDAPTSPRALVSDMVASLDCSKRLKARYPDIRMVFVSDPKTFLGLPLGLRHVVMMQGGNLGVVKEYDGSRFLPLGVMQAGTLAGEAVRETADTHSTGTPGTGRSAVLPNKYEPAVSKRDDVFPLAQDPFMWFYFPPPPPSAPGGVDISPEPVLAGKADGKTGQRVRSTRPAAGSLSWEVPTETEENEGGSPAANENLLRGRQ